MTCLHWIETCRQNSSSNTLQTLLNAKAHFNIIQLLVLKISKIWFISIVLSPGMSFPRRTWAQGFGDSVVIFKNQSTTSLEKLNVIILKSSYEFVSFRIHQNYQKSRMENNAHCQHTLTTFAPTNARGQAPVDKLSWTRCHWPALDREGDVAGAHSANIVPLHVRHILLRSISCWSCFGKKYGVHLDVSCLVWSAIWRNTKKRRLHGRAGYAEVRNCHHATPEGDQSTSARAQSAKTRRAQETTRSSWRKPGHSIRAHHDSASSSATLSSHSRLWALGIWAQWVLASHTPAMDGDCAWKAIDFPFVSCRNCFIVTSCIWNFNFQVGNICAKCAALYAWAPTRSSGT